MLLELTSVAENITWPYRPIAIRSQCKRFSRLPVNYTAWQIGCRLAESILWRWNRRGVYWIPLYQILESRGFQVYLVNAHQIKNVPGRKTDVLDCQWIQKLHTFGLLNSSFRPVDEICVLRSYLRQRDNLISSASTCIQHMQKALTEMNIQLANVISDISGQTGLAIIRAIVGGERDAEKLAKMKDYRILASQETIAKSLQGNWRQEHIFSLRQALALYDIYQSKIAECDHQIRAHLDTLPSNVDIGQKPLPPRKSKRPRGNSPQFDLRDELYRISGADLTSIDGIDVVTAQTIISEIGLDMTRWRTEKNFASWLGLCPNNRITGGKVIIRRSRHVSTAPPTRCAWPLPLCATARAPWGPTSAGFRLASDHPRPLQPWHTSLLVLFTGCSNTDNDTSIKACSTTNKNSAINA